MYHRFSSDTPTDKGDSQFPQSPGRFLGMLSGNNEGNNLQAGSTETESRRIDTFKDKEPDAPTKKRSRDSQLKLKRKKKCAANSKPIDLGESSPEEGGYKRGPNWKEQWILHLIHLRGTMHDKFSGMKKQGVDNWAILHTHLVAACPDFDRSIDACRKKWKKLYDDYKADYAANGISYNDRSSKCKYYSLIDGYMHNHANVLKHVHASANDEDPNSLQREGHEDLHDSMTVSEPTASSSHVSVRKKMDKLATEEAIAVMADQAVQRTAAVKESEAAKLNLLQGMLAMMHELVKKL